MIQTIVIDPKYISYYKGDQAKGHIKDLIAHGHKIISVTEYDSPEYDRFITEIVYEESDD